MANTRKRFANTENQPTLFDLIRQERESGTEGPAEGSINVKERLRLALLAALDHPTKSRWHIAGEMSHLLGTEISKSQLDGYVAESKEHRIPAEYVPAFCRATGSCEPLRILTEAAGGHLMKSEEALRAEIQRFDEEERKARAEKRRRMVYLEAYREVGHLKGSEGPDDNNRKK